MTNTGKRVTSAPLSQVQLGIYMECEGCPDSIKYNIAVKTELPDGTDCARFLSAVRRVAEAHEVFRAVIRTPGGVPSLVLTDVELPFSEETVDDADRACRAARRPFDLENGPLCRFTIFHGPKGDVFFFDVHHLIFDGSSLHAFLSQVASVYDGGEPVQEALSLFDTCLADAQPKDPARVEEYRNFFCDRLGAVDCDAKPVPDRIEPLATDEAASFSLAVEDRFRPQEILQFAKENGVSENAVFLAAFGYALAKCNGTNESFFVTANTGRGDPRLSDTVGMYVRSLPFACRFREEQAPIELVRSAYEDYFFLKKNDCIPFGELAAEYGANMGVTFIFQSAILDTLTFSEGDLPVQLIDEGTSVADLEVMLMRSGEDYRFLVHYRKADYTEAFVRRFLLLLCAVVRGVLTEKTLGAIPLADAESTALIAANNETAVPYPKDKTPVDLFREQAAKTPDAECVVYEDRRYTYRETDELSDRLAQALLARGIGHGKVVGILIPRGEHMALCPLGVLKTGAAYMPLDPTYPPERLNFMMRDAGAAMLITTPELSGIITDEFKGDRMTADELFSLPACVSPLPTPAPEDLFVMLYTSGSTGLPKGVMLSHANITVTLSWERRFFSLGPDCRVTAYASFGFDACAFDTYATIASGAALHIISDAIRLDLPALRDYFNENGITHSVMTTQVGRQFALMGGLRTLRAFSVAGEKLTPLTPPEGFALYNLYGPTEGSILVTGYRVDALCRDIPIGSAIDNVKLYVVDPQGRLLPPGAAGELWLSGPHVSVGYLNRPEKTAEAYGENPFCTDPGYERVYRTGDVVRFYDDGSLQFIGRRDGQVKIRGFRVELTEVEEVIRRFDGVKDATVAAFDDPAGGKFLAAYVVGDAPVDIERLNAFIRGEKPPYMVPAVTMQIDKIPLNQNQKVNRRALPQPERRAENVTAPETETQKKIFELAAEVLGHRAFGIDSDLFEAGLTSIGSLRLNVSLGAAFDAPVKLDDLRQNPTVRRLEALLTAGSEAAVHTELLPHYPITETQKGIFVECCADPDAVTYHIPFLLRCGDGVDPERLAEAFRTALRAHAYALTTLFADEEGEIRARRIKDAEPCVELIRRDTLPAREELVAATPLLDAPLYKAAVYVTKDGTYLFADFHHIIADGTSAAILLRDVDRAYLGLPVEAERYTGFEAALDEQNARATDRLERAKAYYDSVFAGCETESLPPKAPEKDAAAGDVGRFSFVPDTDPEAVGAFCREHRLTANAFFNAAFGLTLSRFSQARDVVFTTVYNGRSDSRLSSAFTMLVKTLPVLVRCEENRAVDALLREVQEQLVNSMANDIYSFAEISAAYGIRADIIFVYQGDAFTFDTLCGEPASFETVLPPVAKAPISVNVYLRGGRYEIESEFCRDLYKDGMIRAVIECFGKVISELLHAEKIGDISYLTDAASRSLAKMNDTVRPYWFMPVHTFVEKHAAETPDRVAIVCDGKSLTYDRLNRMANRIARGLIANGVHADSVCAFLLDRSVYISAVELGILKAGGAFLGVLPSYPDDRVEYCLLDAESPVIITTEKYKAERRALFSEKMPYRTLTVEELLAADADDENPAVPVRPEDLAYCIYTSGSTGKPKGVMIEHRNVACCAQPAEFAYSHYVGENRAHAVLAVTAVTFDVSIFDNLIALMNGLTVCMATDAEIHNPLAIARIIRENHVDAYVATPSFLMSICRVPEVREAMKDAAVLTAGGEAFPPALFRELREIAPSLCIINGYGPSECTMTCNSKILSSPDHITIGGPGANTGFAVMDRSGAVLPPWGCGELIITGDLVGRGYVKLPERTAASFFRFDGRPAYRSGDLVRFNDEGEVEFFGRVDNQVKLRGFRIELDEIENCICSYPDVLQSKVIVRSNGSEEYLAGFYTASSPVDPADLSAYLKTKLTYYMVPDVLGQLDEMPMTPNGKIDKKALPELKKARRREGRRAPRKSTEEQLCDLFRSVLSVEEYYADDNFFEMGGTSLSASKVTMQLMAKGLKVEYQDIFDHPTPESLADYVDGLGGSEKPQEQEKARAEEGDELTDLLRCNTLEHAAEVRREPLGSVLLTGAVGFLGIHVLRELIRAEEGRILCLVRPDEGLSAESRLRNMMMYYFGEMFDDAFRSRITVIDADITDDALPDVLAAYEFDTVINCAACVKHYASDDLIEHINVHGVENLIRTAAPRGIRMIQISTTSVPGVHTEKTYQYQIKMHENELFVIDSMDNKYCISKYHAELKMLEAIRGGMRGKIIRVGNLMGRHSDGEFQINLNTNAFLNALRGFSVIGKCPISHATDPMKFSPIDMTARAIVLLAGTNDCFTAFHADNRFGFDEMQLIESSNRCGVKIVPVPDEEYYADYYRMLGDDRINARLSGLVTNDRPDLHVVDTDNVFTANILYRLGFSWPLVEDSYLDRAIDSLLTLDYFEFDDNTEQ